MRFTLYTDKTIPQCLSSINERIQAGSRSGLEGWTDRNGDLSIAVSTRVARRFTRKTHLHARLEREGGVTVIRGNVPDGAGWKGQMVIFAALLVVGFIFLAGGNALLAIIAVLAGVALYVPLAGDHHNSAVLMREIRSTLKASTKPPSKKPAQVKSASPSAAALSRSAARPAAARKPSHSRGAPGRATKPPPR